MIVRDVVKQQLDERRRQHQEQIERKEKIERRTTKKIQESIECERRRAVQNRIKRIEEQKRFLAESQLKQKERLKELQKVYNIVQYQLTLTSIITLFGIELFGLE